MNLEDLPVSAGLNVFNMMDPKDYLHLKQTCQTKLNKMTLVEFKGTKDLMQKKIDWLIICSYTYFNLDNNRMAFDKQRYAWELRLLYKLYALNLGEVF